MLADVALIDWNKLPTHWSSVRECSMWVALKRGVCVCRKGIVPVHGDAALCVRWHRSLACEKDFKAWFYSLGLFKLLFIYSQLQLNSDFHNWLYSFKWLHSKNFYWEPVTAHLVFKKCVSCLCRLHFKDKNKGAFNFHIKLFIFISILKNIFFQIRPNLPQLCDCII